jgi:hypothetical protein
VKKEIDAKEKQKYFAEHCAGLLHLLIPLFPNKAREILKKLDEQKNIIDKAQQKA